MCWRGKSIIYYLLKKNKFEEKKWNFFKIIIISLGEYGSSFLEYKINMEKDIIF